MRFFGKGRDYDTRIISEKSAYYDSLAKQYGHDPVSAHDVYRLFDEISRLRDAGFTAIRSGWYGKPVNPDMFHVIKLQALKGRLYTVWWGVSLACVPHRWDRRIEWHRTLKSARLDLYETPDEYFSLHDKDWREAETYYANPGYGIGYLSETLAQLWKNSGNEIMAWFASADSLEKAVEKLQAQTTKEQTGPCHHPDPLLVYAFVLARLNNGEEAKTALQDYLHRWHEPRSSVDNLWQALEQVSLSL